MKRGRAALLLLGLVCLMGCSSGSFPSSLKIPSRPPYVPPIPRARLEAAPTDSLPSLPGLVFQPYLWRDFQPVAPADGWPLIAAVRMFDNANATFRPGLKARYVWVLTADEVWGTPIADEVRDGANILTVYGRNGPKWGPGITVDAVLGLTVSADSDSLSLVRFPGILIYRTD